MAITTLDGLLAAMKSPESFLKSGPTTVAGRYFSLAYSAGRPGAITTPAAGVNGESLTTQSGMIPFTNPGGGSLTYLARFQGESSQPGQLVIYDRIWQNSGLSVTSTGSQAITSTAWGARDRSGTTDGEDVLIGMEVSTVMGAGTPTVTLGYTNSAGTAGRSVVTSAMATTMAAGSFIPLGLQAGDTGVRSVQSFQLSATMTSGAIHLVAYRIIASISMPAAGVGSAVDAITGGMPRLYDNSVLQMLFLPSGTTAPVVAGQVILAQG